MLLNSSSTCLVHIILTSRLKNHMQGLDALMFTGQKSHFNTQHNIYIITDSYIVLYVMIDNIICQVPSSQQISVSCSKAMSLSSPRCPRRWMRWFKRRRKHRMMDKLWKVMDMRKDPRAKMWFMLFFGWWNFKKILYFHPENWGNDPIWRGYFSNGLKPLTSVFLGVSSRLGALQIHRVSY